MAWFPNRSEIVAVALAAVVLLAFAVPLAVVQTAHADETVGVERTPALKPQPYHYVAEVTNIYFSSDPIYEGDATVYVNVRNRSSLDGPEEGEATFRVVLEIDPPGSSNTVSYDLGTMAFGKPTSAGAFKTFEKEYTFERTSGLSRYGFKARVYDPSQLRLFDEYSSETSVNAVTYDADVGSINVSRSTVRQGDTATISATFTNQVESNSGDATFDIDFEVTPPSGPSEVLRFTDDADRNFTKNQRKELEKRYRFQQRGIYTIKARIWNPSRTHLFDDSETRVDSTSPYSAQVTDIRISPSPIYVGKATIYVNVRNLSSRNGPEAGAATFDVRLEVDPPGLSNTVYPSDDDDDWDNVSFGRNETVTLSKTYNFAQSTVLSTRYRLKAEVYGIDGKENNWHSDHLFGSATGSEEFQVSAVSYDADVGAVNVSLNTVRQGDTATISATFTNQVESNSGDGTFDIDFEVTPPSGPSEVLRFTDDADRNFTKNQRKELEKRYRFQQRGIYTIKARIWNPSRTHLFDDSETRVDSTSPYAAQVTDIRISPSPIYVGEATIYVNVRNLSSRNGPDAGAATFDVRLEVDPPGFNNTVYPTDDDDAWDNVSFERNETVTLSKTYNFAQSTGQYTRYELKAEVYGIDGKENNWDSDHLFSNATGSEEFQIVDAPDPPDLAIEIAEQVTPIVGKPFSLPVTIANNGGSPSGPLRLIVAFGSFTLDGNINDDVDVQANIEATSQFTIPGLYAGQTRRDTLSGATVTDGLDPGPRFLCVLTEYVNPTTDSDESDNRSCSLIYLLPDMGDAFPGGIQAFFHVDDEFQLGLNVDIDIEEISQSSQATSFAGLGPVLGALASVIVGSIQESSFNYGSQFFWVFVPTKYSTGESEELAEEIVERTTGGLEHREDRIERYEKLALEIARRGQTYGNKFYSVGETEEEKQEFLDTVGKVYESKEGVVEVGEKVINVSEFLIDMAEVTGVEIDLSDNDIFHGHLNHLTADKVSGFLTGVSIGTKTAGLVNDIRITESLNRTIHYGQAKKTLAVLEELALEDAAWEEAVQRAKTELDDMTSPDGLRRWSSAVEQNLPNIVATYAELALKYAVKKAAAKLAGKAIGSVALLAGAPVAIVALPITIAAVFTIDELYELKDETDKFWDGITLAGMSTQVYSHVHRRLRDSGLTDSDRQALEEIRDYLKFGYYKHLGRAAESDPEFAEVDVGIFGDGRITHDIVTSERNSIFHERDEILSKTFGGNWDHTKDFKFLDDAVKPLGIWSDDETMWIVTGQTAHSHQIYRFSLEERSELEGKDLRFLRSSHGANSTPRGIWFDGTYLWILDTYAPRVLGKFDVNERASYSLQDFSFVYGNSQFPKLSGGIWSDGTTMWLTTREDCGIVGLNNIDEYPTGPLVSIDIADRDKEICNLAEQNAHPYGLWSDGKTMWVSDREAGRIFAYSVREGEQETGIPAWGEREIGKEIVTVKIVDVTEENYSHIANNSSPTGIWSDGETIWVADYESDRIFAYTLPDSLSAPQNLTATTVGDSQVNLTWQTPMDTGRAPITGYVVQESDDGLNWTTVSGNIRSTRTSYSRTGLSDWGARYYRIAAINGVGTGPLSDTAVVYQGFSIDEISCTPEDFYAREIVQCSATIGGRGIPNYSYLWETEDGTPVVVISTEDGSGGNKASITWESSGGKPLRVVACRSGDASDYAQEDIPIPGLTRPKVEFETEGACAEATETVQVADVVPSIYFQNPSPSTLPEYIGVGDTFDLEFEVGRKTWVGGPGGITVSFPDLTLDNSVNSGSYYGSDEGRVRTVDSVTTFADVEYLDSGSSGSLQTLAGSQVSPQHLAVAVETDDWPGGPSVPTRTLRLQVTPREAGEFRVQYRYWLCNEERVDDAGDPHCSQYPKQDDTNNPGRDQQDWAVYEFTVTVVPKPEIESMGCDADTVDVGVTVNCTPTYDGGEIDSYTWKAGYGVVGGDPSSGSDDNFATKWSFSGQQEVNLEVCNDVSGCVSEKQTVTVNADPTEPTVVVVPDMDEEEEEPEPSDGGRVLISGLASEWAHSSYSPTDTTIQVRVLPTPDVPTLEITLYDEDGFAAAAGDYVSPGALVLALPDDVWVNYGGISVEMNILGSWVEYTGEFEESLLVLETISGGEQRTAPTGLGLTPAVGTAPGPALTAADHLALGLGEVGQPSVGEIFLESFANCVSQVAVPWLALASQTKGVRISVPVDVLASDYISLAAAMVFAEGDDGEEAALVQLHDLLATGSAPPECMAPELEAE